MMSTLPVSNDAINEAFFAVANAPEFEILHGKWIPAKYWVFLVRKQLKCNEEIKEVKLRKAMEADAAVTSLEDNKRTGMIVKVEMNSKKVTSGRQSLADTKDGKKKRTFIRVNTRRTLLLKDPLDGLLDAEVKKHFQMAYMTYSSLVEHCSATHWLRRLDTNLMESVEVPRVVTPTESVTGEVVVEEEPAEDLVEEGPTEEIVVVEAPIVGLPKTLDMACNEDIKHLLTGIINPKLLKRKDLFIDGEDTLGELRARIKKLGIQYQRQENEATYSALAPNDPLAKWNLHHYEPFLKRFCLPPNKRAFQAVIGTALKIDSECDDADIFQMNNFGGSAETIKGKKLVAIVPSNSKNTLWKNGKRFLPGFYEAIATSDDLDMYTICRTLIKLHKQHCEQAFLDACITMGPKKTPKMDPYRQLAMQDKANLNAEHLRIMRPFLNADRCNPFNSERRMREKMICPTIPPTFLSVIDEDGEKRNGFFLEVKDVVAEEIEGAEEMDELHVIFSADHGQKAFRCHLTCNVIVHGENRSEVKLEKHCLVGQLECKKDTYEILSESSVADGLNKALKLVKDWQLTLPNSNTLIPIKLKCLGDLAWYSLALGKVAMSGKHCWRCRAMHKEFQKDPFFKGRKWTLRGMKERFQKLESGELSRKKKTIERGLVRPMLIDCIEPVDFIVPILHAVILLTNTVFGHVQKWIWYRVEDVPLELIVARSDYARAELDLEARRKECVDVTGHYQEMKSELNHLTPKRGDDFDDEEHHEFFQQQQLLVSTLAASVKAAEKAQTAAEKNARATKKKVSEMEKCKDYGKTKQQLWLTIQRMLREEFNIYWSVYHGGALEGNQARTLLRRAPAVMERIKTMLLEHLNGIEDPEDRIRRATAEEVDLFLNGFERLFQYMDVIVHYGYQPFGSMSDSDVSKAQEAIRLATLLWYKLMPTIPMKVHTWQHLAEDFQQYRGLKSHTDEPIERSHQAGKKDDHRLHAIRNFELKTTCVLKSRATMGQKEVKEMMKDTEAQRKKRKLPPEQAGESQSATARRNYLDTILRLAPLECDFPSMLELNKAVERQVNADDGIEEEEAEESGEEELSDEES